MRIAILHNAILPEPSQDELDVLVQVEVVTTALKNLGHKPVSVPLSLNLEKAIKQLIRISPNFVFNLVESIGGNVRFLYFAPAILDQLGLPYSGAGTHALYLTTNKLLAKERLKWGGIPTPSWNTAKEVSEKGISFKPPYIVKPVCEDASVGVEETALIADKTFLLEAFQERMALLGECFVEAFVHGREFNLSVLGGKNGPVVLPPAEILFVDYPPEKPRIVDYRAKWQTDSFEYQHTVRNFKFPAEDAALIHELTETALRCWQLFDLRGYARVDFRVDEQNQIWVLEINANPCISPGSGFVAAAEQAGLTFDEVIQRIIEDTISKD